MNTVNVHAAKTHLSRLLDEVAAGRDVIIARAGKPVARLVPFEPVRTERRRVLGSLAGQFDVPADFDASLPPNVLDSFEGV